MLPGAPGQVPLSSDLACVGAPGSGLLPHPSSEFGSESGRCVGGRRPGHGASAARRQAPGRYRPTPLLFVLTSALPRLAPVPPRGRRWPDRPQHLRWVRGVGSGLEPVGTVFDGPGQAAESSAQHDDPVALVPGAVTRHSRDGSDACACQRRGGRRRAADRAPFQKFSLRLMAGLASRAPRAAAARSRPAMVKVPRHGRASLDYSRWVIAPE
jgi:hypothetical protein